MLDPSIQEGEAFMAQGAEADRLAAARDGVAWKRWGPYLSERQWGRVREDYSDNGDAWSYFTHDQRSRACTWGEDGIAGFCDDHLKYRYRWKDRLLFHEYFHGDNGAGLGASHQTGWTGLVARIIRVLGYLHPRDLLENAWHDNLVYSDAPR